MRWNEQRVWEVVHSPYFLIDWAWRANFTAVVLWVLPTLLFCPTLNPWLFFIHSHPLSSLLFTLPSLSPPPLLPELPFKSELRGTDQQMFREIISCISLGDLPAYHSQSYPSSCSFSSTSCYSSSELSTLHSALSCFYIPQNFSPVPLNAKL